MERRDDRTRRATADVYDIPSEYYPKEKKTIKYVCNCEHHTHYDSNGEWSLQDAVASALK